MYPEVGLLTITSQNSITDLNKESIVNLYLYLLRGAVCWGDSTLGTPWVKSHAGLLQGKENG